MVDYGDNKCKQFFASEILVKDKVNIEKIISIYVFNKKIEIKVKKILKENCIKTIDVHIKPNFFR